jgi:hypothetical protein
MILRLVKCPGGGILDRGKCSVLRCAVLIPMLLACSVAQQQSEHCNGAGSLRVARFDDGQRRIFVVGTSQEISTPGKAGRVVRKLSKLVHECRPNWNSTWVVSFFTDAKFVGYKDDPSLRTFVTDGSWSRAYIAEYDRHSGTMNLMPASGKPKHFEVVP